MPRKSSGNPAGRPKEFCEEKALEAAMLVFAAKGYENASLSDLTSAMQINRFSMYSSFGNKEALYVKAMERFNKTRREGLHMLLSGDSAKDSVARLLRNAVTKFTDCEHGVCFITQAPINPNAASPETQALMAKRRAEAELAIRDRLERAVREGELPSDTSAVDLAKYFAVMIQGFALQAQHGGKREDLFRVVDIAMSKWPDQTAVAVLDAESPVAAIR
jgi:AcrR family transcriptional regulator